MPRPPRLYELNGYTQMVEWAEEVLPFYAERRYLFFRNESPVGNMRVGFGQWSTRNPLDGVLLAPGEYLEFNAGFVPTQRLWVISDRVGLRYTGWEA